MSYSSTSRTNWPVGLISATSSAKAAKRSRTFSSSRKDTPSLSDSLRNVTATATSTSSTVSPEHRLISSLMTGYRTDQSHGREPIANPSNRSRLPSKRFCSGR